MFWFGFGILCAIVAVIVLCCIPFASLAKSMAVAIVAAFLFGIAWTGASYAHVPTNNTGIVTSFSKPTGRVTGAGLKWTKPWENVQDWDATRQSYNYLNANCDHPGDGSLWVSIDGQREACIRLQVNWKTTSTEAAVRNWAAYRASKQYDTPFLAFADREVQPDIADAVQAVFRPLNPLALIDPKTGDATVPDLDGQYTPALTAAINSRLGKDIQVESIAWGVIGYDAPTRASISAFAQKNYDTRNLSVDKANAQTRATIAGQSGVPASEQACLDMIKALGKGEPGLCVGGNVALTRPIG